ncbi:hypothetical protein [Alloscardovia theropitheci]|nr:hypothetical protein [Alloscardovia theropitheci]
MVDENNTHDYQQLSDDSEFDTVIAHYTKILDDLQAELNDREQ